MCCEKGLLGAQERVRSESHLECEPFETSAFSRVGNGMSPHRLHVKLWNGT